MHPLYNLREICKQSALLEDHLNNEQKRCEDCIRKHFLTIEALLEEALSLDTKQKWFDLIEGKPELVRELQEKWIDGGDMSEIAQGLRELRKDFAPVCFDLREMTEESRLASGRMTLASHVADVHFERTTHNAIDFGRKISPGGFDFTKKTPPRDLLNLVGELQEVAKLFDRGLLQGKPGSSRKVLELAGLISNGDMEKALRLAKSLTDLPGLPPDLFATLYRYGD
jgi:hypothetical protein